MTKPHEHGTDRKNETGDDFASDYGHMKKSLGKLQDDVSHLLENTLDAGRSGAAALRHRAASAVSDAKDRYVTGSIEHLGEVISEHPITSAAVALGVGYILAKMMSRR